MDDSDYLEITKMNDDDYRLFERIASALERIADSLAGKGELIIHNHESAFEWITGKWYRRRDDVCVYCESTNDGQRYPVRMSNGFTYTLGGEVVMGQSTDQDIVTGPFDDLEEALASITQESSESHPPT